ncbi:hypothetical protein [Streptococcus salivarius]
MSKADKIEICSVYLPTVSLDRQAREVIHENFIEANHKAVIANSLDRRVTNITQIGCMSNPHILLVEINEENIIAKDIILDYSYTDIVFHVFDTSLKAFRNH